MQDAKGLLKLINIKPLVKSGFLIVKAICQNEDFIRENVLNADFINSINICCNGNEIDCEK